IPDESDIEKSKENLNQPITQTGSLNTCYVLISDDGHLIHQLNIGNKGDDQAYHLVSDAEGNAYASGLSYNSENKSSQVWLTKLNNKCNEEWTEHFGNAGINLGGKMDISTWGYLQVPLMVSKSGAIMCDHEYDFTLMQYDSEGTMLGYNCYGDKEIELPRMVATSPDGSTWLLGDVLMAEDNEDGRLAQHDTWLRQLDIDGEAIVAAHTYTEVEELATDLAFLPGKVVTIANRMTKVNDVAYRKYEDNVYITCLTTQPKAISNTPLLQLIEPMDLIMDETEQVRTHYAEPEQEEKSAQQNSGQHGSLEVRLYPNPTRNAITIMANALIKEVRIMSSTGCLVQSDAMVQQLQIEIDTNELAAGTYLIEIVTVDGTEVKRLVVE
ncbi:MAG: T9SS type A sorting domain-containing protein, partial [Flavobacteriales bacterium]